LAEVNQEHSVYLIEVEDQGELAKWIAHHHQEVFENEVNGWCTDPALWPRYRSLRTLQEWRSRLHTVVADTSSSAPRR
jgi:hypothetical protein